MFMTVDYSTDIKNAFNNKAITDMGVTVSYEAVTKTTSNEYDDQTLTYATATDITAHFSIKKDSKWTFDTEGEIQGLDALILTPSTIPIYKNDKFTVNSLIYVCKDVRIVNVQGTIIYYKGNLYLYG